MAYYPLPPSAYLLNGRIVIPGLVGNIPTGNLKVRVRATGCRIAGSPLLSNAPFTEDQNTGVGAVTPPAPIFVSYSDQSNVYTFRAPTGYTYLDIDYVLNGMGPYPAVSSSINVGSGFVGVNALELYVREQLPVRYQGLSLLSHIAFTPDPAGVTTPETPTGVKDDALNTLSIYHPLGLSELLVSINGGAYTALPDLVINVGNVNVPVGYYKLKTKSAPGRNESSVYNSPSFTATLAGSTPPQVTADDQNNTLVFSSVYGDNEILVSVNNGAFNPYLGLINVGNVSRAAGYYKAKVKAAAGRTESSLTPSPAFNAEGVFTPQQPSVFADDTSNTLSFSSPLGESEIVVSINNSGFLPYSGPYNVGNVNLAAGYYLAKIKSGTNRNESAPTASPVFTIAPVVTTPAAPIVNANDATNTLTASSPLGNSEIVYSTNGGSYVPYNGIINVGDVNRAEGYYKFKIKAGVNRNESSVVDSPVFTTTVVTPGNTTPPAPTVAANDTTNTLSFSHSLGSTEIEVSANGGSFEAYTGTINVGDVARPSGYYQARTRAATGRNVSSMSASPAFTVAPIPGNTTPAAPTVSADDAANTLSFSHALGTSEIEVSENSGSYAPYNGTINVGDFGRPAGYYQARIKAATGRNTSASTPSPAFTATPIPGNTTPEAPNVSGDDAANTLSFSHALGTSELEISENSGSYIPYTSTIQVGDVNRPAGYWQARVKAATGRNSSAPTASPAFTQTPVVVPGNTTPVAPTVQADDAANTLAFSHALGTSEIEVSINNSGYVPYSGPYPIGNVALAAGYYVARVKAATGRNASATVSSPAFTVTNTGPVAPVFDTTLVGPSDDEPTGTQLTSNPNDLFKFNAKPLGDGTGKVMVLNIGGTVVGSVDFLVPYATRIDGGQGGEVFSFQPGGAGNVYYGRFTDIVSGEVILSISVPA